MLTDHGAAIAGAILYLCVGAAGYPVGALLSIMLVDRVERRIASLSSTVVWFIGTLLIVAVSAQSPFRPEVSWPPSLWARTFKSPTHSQPKLPHPLAGPWIRSVRRAGRFAAIGSTGLCAGLVALLGPNATGRRLEEISA
ncbi:hypothetical protein [Mycobacterium sp. 852002-50816_SCH5313054-b]|uniref:hypothetical protein n=1 Tax=Mycobacterium sp. 852002-50816_SCH5313054-b TaxID=1834092 RepID=UPI00082DFCE4|nr:hypothetical protein [Mycobacterium sp. 852002-50816_SCH5313054-b]